MFLKNKILLLTVALLSISACKDEKASDNAVAQIPVVEALKVSPQDVPLYFEYPARAQGSKETEVRARVGGILLKRNYVEGSEVAAGDVLFEIDPDQYKVALNKAKAQLLDEDAKLINAQGQWDRISKLFKQGIVSEKSRDDALANLNSAKASKALAEAEVQGAQLNLDYTKVRAPISGVTSMETQSEGSLISVSGDGGLLTHITQVDPIYVIFSAADSDMFKLGSMVDSGLVVTKDNSKKNVVAALRMNNGSYYPYSGEINFINPSIDENTGTIKLRAVFPNPDKKLMPGQFSRLILQGLTRKDALIVPQEAVMQSPAGPMVYRVNSQGAVEAVNIELGFTTPTGKWIVDRGLNAGDTIVTGGTMKIRPGMSVKTSDKEIENEIEFIDKKRAEFSIIKKAEAAPAEIFK